MLINGNWKWKGAQEKGIYHEYLLLGNTIEGGVGLVLMLKLCLYLTRPINIYIYYKSTHIA